MRYVKVVYIWHVVVSGEGYGIVADVTYKHNVKQTPHISVLLTRVVSGKQ